MTAQEGTCSIPRCDRIVYARGWCRKHYDRWRLKGDLAIGRGPLRVKPAEERFWPKVDTNGPVPTYAPHLGPCWIWLAHVYPSGYAGFGRGRRGSGMTYAHIWSYEHHVGPIPGGLELDHLCRVRRCVNPDHLEPVTHAENVRRASSAQTHCRHGHPYDEANTYIDGVGKRHCRTCDRERHRMARGARRN